MIKSDNLKKSLERFDGKTFGSLLVLFSIPAIGTTTRIRILGDYDSDGGFNIASQLQYFPLIQETLFAMLVLPLFFFIGRDIKNNDNSNAKNKIYTSMIITFITFTMFAFVINVFAKELLEHFNETAISSEAVKYLRGDAGNILLDTIYTLLYIVLLQRVGFRKILTLVLVRIIGAIALDYLFVISMNQGIGSLAGSKTIMNVVLITTIVILIGKEYDFSEKIKLDFKGLKEGFKVGRGEGLETLIRNVAFTYMILKLFDNLGDGGTYGIVNSFIGGGLLLPTFAISDLANKDVSINKVNDGKERGYAYFFILSCFVIVGIITIPLWPMFMRNVLGLDNDMANDVFKMSVLMLPAYITFKFNDTIDSLFHSTGKTFWLFAQTVVVHLVVYVPMFIMYKTGAGTPTVGSIAGLFMAGVVFDSIVTIFIFTRFIKKDIY